MEGENLQAHRRRQNGKARLKEHCGSLLCADSAVRSLVLFPNLFIFVLPFYRIALFAYLLEPADFWISRHAVYLSFGGRYGTF